MLTWATITDRGTYRQPRVQFLIACILITLLTFLIYSNSFSSSFHFDDKRNIINNSGIRTLSDFYNFSFSGTRYIGVLSFSLNYYFGGLNVFGYHLVNTIIHILNGILIWWFVTLTFRTPVMGRGAVNLGLNSLIALLSSLIFVSHPVQTQAVTYIVQRFASLATLFYLLSLVLFIKGKLSSGTKYRLVFYLFSLISAILAMKTKEISFTLPFVILLYEFYFFRERLLKRAYLLIPFLLPLLIIPMTLIGKSTPLGDIAGKLRTVSQETDIISRGDYLLTQFRVIVTYIRLLFFPINQSLDYDYPLFHSFLTPGVFLSFLFLLFLFGLGIYLFVRFRIEGNGYALLVSFGIFWFFITLSVESSIIPIRDVIFEHRLYLPSVGAVVAFSSTVMYAVEQGKRRMPRGYSLLTSCISILCLVVPLSIAAYQRNLVWKDDITLWEDVVRKSPLNARGYNNLGAAYKKEGRIEDAIAKYKTAIMLYPDYAGALYNLGVAYDKMGRTNEAIEKYKTALRLDPDISDAHYNLGLAYARQARTNEAMEEFRTTLRLSPEYAKAHGSLGAVYVRQGRLNEAIVEYVSALRLKPDDATVHGGLGFAYYTQGRLNEAIEQYKAGLRLQPDDAGLHNELGLAYARQGRAGEAIEEYRIALKLNPIYADVHNNLGITYANNGRMDEAIEEFKAALKLKPDHENASSNLNLAYQRKGKEVRSKK